MRMKLEYGVLGINNTKSYVEASSTAPASFPVRICAKAGVCIFPY
jgi:hypothetical protein